MSKLVEGELHKAIEFGGGHQGVSEIADGRLFWGKTLPHNLSDDLAQRRSVLQPEGVWLGQPRGDSPELLARAFVGPQEDVP